MTRPSRAGSAWANGLLLSCWAFGSALAQAPPLDLAELEAAGAVIGEVRVLNQDIFDTADPREDKLLFRWANRLHIRTRREVIEHSLLFKRGDRLSVKVIEETERVLRGTRYLYDVQLQPVAYHDGAVDIEVRTRDTWSLDPGISAGRSGGANTSSINLREYNLLGTGIAVSYGRSNSVDRSGNEFQISDDRAFGGFTSLRYSRSDNNDGKREAASIGRPFYALDTHWSASASVSKDDRIDAVYNAGISASEYRHRQKTAQALGGWSAGRVEGWAQRYSVGVALADDTYALEPGRVAPPELPPDEKLVTPFVRYELIEDRFERLQNRNQMGRPEFFALGLASTLQLGRATTSLGSSHDAWLYSATVSRGFEPAPDHTLTGSASVAGQYGAQVRRQRLGGVVQYYQRQSARWLFYASLSADVLKRPNPADSLLLGGDSGLRGYPLRYQSGLRRVLLTLEERAYSDLYLYRLFRVGGAAFFDAGRAWGGGNLNTTQPGWLGSAGVGLRFFSVRSAFSNVLHVDLAFPLDPDVNVKRLQFGVKTRTSF